jgi:tetratricopeptide (TPR) repeat protein/tRNA A-37 threonylcarbamoyl transferase component Bud32
VYHEFALREELGEDPDWEDYLRQFPQHAAVLRLLRQADQVVEQALAPATPAMPPAAWFRGYDLLEEIGRGGMGVVFKARQRSLDRVVALKMIRAGEYSGAEERKRFDSEARAVARLQHPNIVQIYEVGEAAGQPFLSLEFVEGQSLAQRLTGTPWPARPAASLLEALARAVHYAHGKGVVHRDLKPSNVLLAGGAEAPAERCMPKVTDFGLAKRLDQEPGQSRSGAIVGTPSYMAPEQAGGHNKQVGPASDIYALGAILYELLTGRPPFQSATLLETLEQVRCQEPVPPRRLNPAVCRDLETICLKCLRKDPARRYACAADLADDLGRFQRGEPIRARPVGPAERGWGWCRRHPAAALLVAALTLALVGGFAGIVDQWRRADAARGEAEASDAQAQELLNELLQTSPVTPLQWGYSQRLPNLDTLRRAEAHFESLLRRRPGDTRVRIALTNVRGSVGVLCGLRGQVAEMEACFQGARDLWEALARQEPRNPEYRDWLATTYDWQSRATGGQGQLARSLRLGQQAYALWQQLAEEQPGNMTVLQKLADRRWDWLGLRDPAYGEEGMRPFEEARALLDKLLGPDPANTSLRQRLAVTYLVLGECHHGRRSLPEALRCWRQAYEHFRDLAQAQPDDPLVKLNLALCCSRLMGGQPTDPYYTQAVALFGQAGKRLTALAQQHPGHEWPRHALLETYCALAVCHWQAGRADEAEHTLQEQVRSVVALVSEDAAGPQLGFKLLDCLLRGADSLREAKHAGALALAREAGALAEQYADTPSRHPAFCERLALCSVRLSALQCQLGEPGDALTQGEQARRLYAGLHRAASDMPEYGSGLSAAWVRIAKARWELGRREEALAAFREAAAVQRRVLAQAPSVHAYRLQLSRCYDHLAHWGGLAGDRAGVAAALLEREKLWPNNSEELMEVSRDFQELAEAVGKNREQLSAEEQAERQGYLAHSERARRAALLSKGAGESAEKTAAGAGKR